MKVNKQGIWNHLIFFESFYKMTLMNKETLAIKKSPLSKSDNDCARNFPNALWDIVRILNFSNKLKHEIIFISDLSLNLGWLCFPADRESGLASFHVLDFIL